MTTATEISNRIIEAVMAQKLAPGSRLGEQQLAMLFDCSRTIVREALTRLATRGIVTVSARRGWYVIEPSQDEAREAFEARRVIELGLLHQLKVVDKAALRQLKSHLQREKAALAGTDVGMRSFLLGDFHVCLAECLGNSLLADTLRDFTARTTLIAMLYQSVARCGAELRRPRAHRRGAGGRRHCPRRSADVRAHRHGAVGPAPAGQQRPAGGAARRTGAGAQEPCTSHPTSPRAQAPRCPQEFHPPSV